ncbi:hypothetical protein E4T38_08914 [Aureobasidium subglaciale]|nr:hypothetical protein E4T38_08914 [Aureobasidium subglaciale]KAI5214689.1 hypothetical protein E4T40_08840 [Aureobasidium subglaciale]KAI5217566.1 hypothetical protein E4T41_08781 [Aureobasidium subglaciale]KAI5255125.1 hypothetical protein E4T46_08784 [Aureobasidium subglaciale]
MDDQMREEFRNEMFDNMVVDCIDGNSGLLFGQPPIPPEQRIQELDSDEEPAADPTEEDQEKKKEKNKKKYLRKKEKAQAEKAQAEKDELLRRLSELREPAMKRIAALSIKDKEAASSASPASINPGVNTATDTDAPQPKLSKRQKKTLLKKSKQAQAAASESETAGSLTDGSLATKPKQKDTESRHVKSEAARVELSKEGSKALDVDSKKQRSGKGVLKESEAEVEDVMATVAKRFGQ